MLVDVGDLNGPVVVEVRRFGDDRGYFCETYNQAKLAELGIDVEFVQDNESLSSQVGTVRGLHYQMDPFAQGKLVRVVKGAVDDVVVDIRVDSPSFGNHAVVRLDGETGRQLWVPPGFAHGFCSLEPDMIMAYKVTAFYSGEADRSLKWNDPEIAVHWPEVADSDTLSEKDRSAKTLAELKSNGELF